MVLSTTISGISRHKAENSLDCGRADFFSILIRSFNEKWISVSKLSQRWAALWTRWCQTWISEFSVHTHKSYLCLCCCSTNTCGASITSPSFKALFYHFEYFIPLSYIVIAVFSPASWCVWSDISAERWCSSRRRQICRGANEVEGGGRGSGQVFPCSCNVCKASSEMFRARGQSGRNLFQLSEMKNQLNSQKHPDQAALLFYRGYTLET